MKLDKDGSHEYQILRLLSKEPDLSSASSFECVVPVLDFLYFDHHWFVVMPRLVFLFMPRFLLANLNMQMGNFAFKTVRFFNK